MAIKKHPGGVWTADTTEDAADLFEMIALNAKRAREASQAWQLSLKPGDKAFRLYDVEGRFGRHQLLTIYYEIIDSPFEEDRQKMAADPHIKLVNGYSQVEPDGEMGTVLCGLIHGLLTEEQWDEAKEAGWPDISYVLKG